MGGILQQSNAEISWNVAVHGWFVVPGAVRKFASRFRIIDHFLAGPQTHSHDERPFYLTDVDQGTETLSSILYNVHSAHLATKEQSLTCLVLHPLIDEVEIFKLI